MERMQRSCSGCADRPVWLAELARKIVGTAYYLWTARSFIQFHYHAPRGTEPHVAFPVQSNLRVILTLIVVNRVIKAAELTQACGRPLCARIRCKSELPQIRQ